MQVAFQLPLPLWSTNFKVGVDVVASAFGGGYGLMKTGSSSQQVSGRRVRRWSGKYGNEPSPGVHHVQAAICRAKIAPFVGVASAESHTDTNATGDGEDFASVTETSRMRSRPHQCAVKCHH